jgi:lactaldehyde dehydrogenase
MSQLATDRYDADILVGGTWLSGDERAEVIHPYDGQTVGSAPLASADDARAAIAAADSAFADSTLSAYERYELLSYAADALEDDTEDMARLITGEQGKPLSEARSEVSRAVQTLRLSAEEAKRQFGESIPMDAQQGFDRSHAFTQREPLGVVVGITPFNFPLRSSVEVSPQDFFEPVVGVEGQAEEVQIAL